MSGEYLICTFYGRTAIANVVFDYRVTDRPFTDMVVKPIREHFDGLPGLCRQVERFLSPADELLDAAGYAVIQTHDYVGFDHLLRLTPRSTANLERSGKLVRVQRLVSFDHFHPKNEEPFFL